MPARYRLAALAAALLVPLAAGAQSTVYRWVDKNGKVHYSDSPPAQDARNVSQKRMGTGQGEAPQLPYATQQAMKTSPVVLYVSPTCGEFCAAGRDLLSRRGIPFSERDVSNPADAEAVKKLIGSLGVPVLAVGEKAMKGYSEGGWHGALDTAGYPRTALPGQRNPMTPPPAAAAPTPPKAEVPKTEATAAEAPPAPAK
ncbi:MAG TPA: glutaredoxin family protein [Usitatibacteraceae bacterium]|nr:glutaredoxin family protein [Usitatibacteraceae bacterium]